VALDIDSYLSNDENIVASYQKNKNRYYATDRRLIFTRKNQLMDASYNHITTISMVKVRHKILIALGVILLLTGFVLMSIGIFFGTGANVFVIGLIFIPLFFVIRGSKYSIKLSSGEEVSVPLTKSSNVEAFIKAVRDKIR